MAKKILFVDDETSITGITELFFIRHGYKYLIASSGEEAITTLEQEKSEIGVIFLDLMMPGISGFDVLTYIREHNINIPTIVQSGLTDSKDMKRALDLGATDFMIKPYNKHDLFQYIKGKIE